MGETKVAQLKHEQINEIKQLEEKLDVTLIAYDLSTTNGYTQQNNDSNPINPS